MRKINILICLSAIILLSLQSCKLETVVYDTINPSIFPKTADDAKALVTANAYGAFLNNGYEGIFNCADGHIICSDIISDIGSCNWSDRNALVYGRWTVSTRMYIPKMWNIYVKHISMMTLTMDRIKDIDMNDDLKKQYMAELRCGRGWLAFLLYDFYGPIIIADLETLKNPLEEKILPRLSEEEMQSYIITELTEAAKDLPYNYKKDDFDYGRFTKGLCNTVLMKLYMMIGQYDKAETLGRELMKPEYGYALVEKYSDIFTAANEKNAETIWANNCRPGYQEHKWQPHVIPRDYPTDPPTLTKWGGVRVTWDFFHSFEPGDTRREGIVYEYTGSGGIVHSEELDVPSNGILKTGPAPVKYEIDKTSTGENSQIDWIVYRYADVLTLLSEAIVRKSNTVTQEAVNLLNQIRTRAGLPQYAISDFASPRDFLDKLLMERAHELYAEGTRRQDIIRDGSYVERMKRKCAILGEPTLVNENYLRIPLPQEVIDEGKGIIKQNPGY
jgi:hypothetical protein